MSYSYQPLSTQRREIRMFHLQPGQYGDPLEIRMFKTELPDPAPPQTSQLPIAKIRDSLPNGWNAYMTRLRQTLFVKEDVDGEEETSWTHPSPDFDPALYSEMPIYPPPEYEPIYEALSYVWGDPSLEKSVITVMNLDKHGSGDDDDDDDDQNCGSLMISYSLDEALRHLRHTDGVRTIWVDQICINQQDLDERGHQVKLMRYVYQYAHRVVAWLGPQSDDSDRAIEVLAGIAGEVVTVPGRLFQSPTATKTGWHKPQMVLSYSQTDWEAVLNLYKRPWFYRLWVWQEIRLPNRRTILQCGRRCITRSDLVTAACCVRAKYIEAIDGLHAALDDSSSFTSLYNYADYFRDVPYLLATDSRDKVYGILGMVPTTLSKRIVPSYALSVGEVYRQAVLASISGFHRADILKLCKSVISRKDAPSWVPNFEVSDSSSTQPGHQESAGLSPVSMIDMFNKDILALEGVFCGTIEITSEIFPTPKQFDQCSQVVRRFLSDLDSSQFTLTEKSYEAMATACAVGYCADTFPGEHWPSIHDLTRALKHMVGTSEDQMEAQEFNSLVRFLLRARGRKLVFIRDGTIGLAPTETQPGDLLCVLLGCCTPMVLRKMGQHYTVIGSAYARALENAQALLGPLPSGWRPVSRQDHTSQFRRYYVNETNGLDTLDDPRLEPLSSHWQAVDREWTPEDPAWFREYSNKTSGEVINYDPRMTAGALRKKGVPLETFALR